MAHSFLFFIFLLEQLVNPKLTLPYWDFTIEELEAENSGDDDELVINPPLFQDSWFGTADPDDNTVSEKILFHGAGTFLFDLFCFFAVPTRQTLSKMGAREDTLRPCFDR